MISLLGSVILHLGTRISMRSLPQNRKRRPHSWETLACYYLNPRKDTALISFRSLLLSLPISLRLAPSLLIHLLTARSGSLTLSYFVSPVGTRAYPVSVLLSRIGFFRTGRAGQFFKSELSCAARKLHSIRREEPIAETAVDEAVWLPWLLWNASSQPTSW